MLTKSSQILDLSLLFSIFEVSLISYLKILFNPRAHSSHFKWPAIFFIIVLLIFVGFSNYEKCLTILTDNLV